MLQLTTILFLIAGSVLAVLHSLALSFSLYWYFWWLDIPMHILGGIVIALAVFTLFDVHILRNRSLLSVATVLSVVLLAAIVWEVYEIGIGIPIEDGHWIDTSIDLVMGLSGGYIGWIIGKQIRNIR